MGSKKQKRATDKPSSRQKELEKRLGVLRGQLTKTEKALAKAKNRAERWQKEATAQKKSAARARARVEKLRQKLDGAPAGLEPVADAAAMDVTVWDPPVAESTTVDDVTVDEVTVPDETWSVVQLRAEARARGLTGMSNKPKAQLIAALT